MVRCWILSEESVTVLYSASLSCDSPVNGLMWYWNCSMSLFFMDTSDSPESPFKCSTDFAK